jgi:hypothetical protein
MYGTSRFRAVLVCLTVGCAAWLSGCSSSSPAAPRPMTYNLGERVPAGHITYTVFETQWMTHLGEGMDARVPQNRFLMIRMNIVNGGSSGATIPNFTVVDDNGNSYDELSDGEGVSQWIGYLRSVRSTDYLEGNIVFDAPPAHYKLHLADDTGTNKAMVDLPLNFNAEAPTDLTLPPTVARPPAASGQK